MAEQRLCEGRICIVTGGARGLGREYALMLAEHGAKVVVNDFGGARDGTGGDAGPAQEVVDEIVAAGGEAVANGADVSSFAEAEALDPAGRSTRTAASTSSSTTPASSATGWSSR